MKRDHKAYYRAICTTGVLWMVLVLQTVNISLAQDSEPTKEQTLEDVRNDIQVKQSRLKEEIKTTEAAINKKEGAPTQKPLSLLEKKLEMLKQMDLIYDQQLLQVKQSLDVKQTLEQLQNELTDLESQGIATEPPYPFLFLDELKEKQIVLENQTATYSETVKTAEASLQAAKNELETKEKNYRSIKEEVEAKDANLSASTDLVLAKLSIRLAKEEVGLRRYGLAIERLKGKTHQLRLEILRKKISLVEPMVQFAEKDLEKQIVEIERSEIKLNKDLEKAKTNEELTHSNWVDVKKELTKDLSPGQAEEKQRDAQQWKTWNETHHLEIELLSQSLAYKSDIKKIWQDRYDLFHKKESLDLAGLGKEIKQAEDKLKREEQLLKLRQKECQNDILSLGNQLDAAKESSRPTRSLNEQIEALKTQKKLFNEGLVTIQSAQREYRKLKNEVAARKKQTSIQDWLTNLSVVAGRVWDYEITSIEDDPITVGKILLGFLLLVVGFYVSNYLTAKMGKQLVARISLDQAAAFAFQRIGHYLLLVLIVLFVLSLVRIPLTFFTVIGGALAIGVGFGSQNIVNNFLSGLILMVERPIRIGDIVEAEHVLGTVEWLGARSTRIKTFDNLRLVVPNSTLLQNKFINWSLSDDIVRREIKVGVLYGSPVQKVDALLQQASAEHSLVEKYPKPVVLFDDFGDNALIFILLIWLRMSRTGKAQLYLKQVESQLRFRIDELFRENNITIAFPQRDVHLDTIKPLSVHVKYESVRKR